MAVKSNRQGAPSHRTPRRPISSLCSGHRLLKAQKYDQGDGSSYNWAYAFSDNK
uniref:Uncharacterized protein n=1 Tax=Arundo donax TaxID=35708 RepID=A0A0A9CSZ1_ARUDO